MLSLKIPLYRAYDLLLSALIIPFALFLFVKLQKLGQLSKSEWQGLSACPSSLPSLSHLARGCRCLYLHLSVCASVSVAGLAPFPLSRFSPDPSLPLSTPNERAAGFGQRATFPVGQFS